MTATAPGRPRPVTPLGLVAELVADVERRLGEGDHDEATREQLRADLRRAGALASGLDPYLEACTSAPSSALVALEERTRHEDWRRQPVGGPGLEQEMLSGHVEGATLAMLVHLSGARRVLEVGMFTGYSALAMAEALADDGRVVACEIDTGVAAIAQECFDASPAGRRIDVRVGAAIETLAALARDGEQFDLVFVDADKGGYAGYLDLLLDTDLLAPGAVVCVDNTLMQGEPWVGEAEARSSNGRAIEDFNARLAEDPRVVQVLLPLRDGLTLIRRA